MRQGNSKKELQPSGARRASRPCEWWHVARVTSRERPSRPQWKVEEPPNHDVEYRPCKIEGRFEDSAKCKQDPKTAQLKNKPGNRKMLHESSTEQYSIAMAGAVRTTTIRSIPPNLSTRSAIIPHLLLVSKSGIIAGRSLTRMCARCVAQRVRHLVAVRGIFQPRQCISPCIHRAGHAHHVPRRVTPLIRSRQVPATPARN